MPGTRSSSRLATAQSAATASPSHQPSGAMKRKSAATTPDKKAKKPKPASKKDSQVQGDTVTETLLPAAASEDPGNEDTPVPAVLTFDFEKAKQHLIGVDARFQDLFSKMACRPFEHLEQVHPFRALAISILGQQISWKAARSITHKFIRLFNPTIPEAVTDEAREEAMEVFPSPHQVASMDATVLRTAGLSARKAEYIQDLANRFADGRLSTEKLRTATDEELADMLIQVKGIGRWTVDMFAIFSLRRPDILPVGDLGVQRGMVRWFLAQHSPAHPYGLSPEKVGGASAKSKQKTPKALVPAGDDADLLPGTADAVNIPKEDQAADDNVNGLESAVGETSLLPTPFTPSINRTLKKAPKEEASLPSGLTISVLKSRLDGKKVK
ncbi:DNA glycosylase [Ephemerocybe angulata]|uniref:DNA glycosylase n=1 Tax=Ephemerocybe angulata TaxID=980116 RepID=A0A8H6I9H4_9AGAR|nr:DNA glycosylase [Tulosesus angulatus]